MVKDDLDKPTTGKMQIVYSAFADIIMGVTKEYFDAAVEACQSENEHYEIYSDSLLLMIFYQHLHLLMKKVGFPEFIWLKIKDLLQS